MDAEKTLCHLSAKASSKRFHLIILMALVSISSAALAVGPEPQAGWHYAGKLLAALGTGLLCLCALWLYVSSALGPAGAQAARRGSGT
ncbi:hypothetical protein ASC94_28355 [Massilia sp. Root418]|uniref:hypothetical protein n=1 Tax=Massilia sp. Root418 TaxID=1736532 RepID=UPI0006F5D33A|nr:hypothetical protein [Massilia sp. Root418]KQW87310.1 hypothetical protein ASC94_28355 [Massilia sp. Root418]